MCLKFEKDWDRKWAHDGLSETDENGGEDSLSPGANASPLDVGLTANQEVPQTRGERGVVRSGFMVSGSSDCSVCIWDLHLGAALDQDDGASVDDPKTGNASEEDDREVNGDVRQILRGHVGGVLDLRIDSQWIVSWCVTSQDRVHARFCSPMYVARKMPSSVCGTGRPCSFTACCEAMRALSMRLGCKAAEWYVDRKLRFEYSGVHRSLGQC